SVDVKSVRWRTNSQERVVDIRLSPLLSDGVLMGTTITYTDVTELHRVQEELTTSKRELEADYEELQSTVEELETTNEELQSTNEELETTNEELQSTNEELETMNEELQSTNDELEAMNEIQGERAVELDRLNLFLEGILGNLGLGVVVLDSEQRVQLWNNSASELWGLRDSEVIGAHFLTLDIGFPVEKLKAAMRRALSPAGEATEQTFAAVNRRGREFHCHVQVMPLTDSKGGVYGVILLM